MNEKDMIQSPCIQLCKLDKSGKVCISCWRTIDEIIQWGDFSEDQKRKVWSFLSKRKQASYPLS